MLVRNVRIVNGAAGFIEAHLGGRLDLDIVARAVCYSRHHLHRVFTGTVGMTVHDYVQRRRLTEAARALVFSRRTVLDIAQGAGYSGQQAFTGAFRALYKRPPRRFREEGAFYALQLPFRFAEADPAGDRPAVDFAVEGDIPAWMGLVRLVIDGFPRLDEAEHTAALRRAVAGRGALILRGNPEPAGIMIVDRAGGSIDFFAVHPLLRGAGAARALLDRALAELDAHAAVTTTTFREGDRADTGHRRALRALGFAEGELLTEFGYPTQRMRLPGAGRARHG